MKENIKRINELIQILNKASEVYYSEGGEIMSDKEFDTLYDELSSLEKETGYQRSDSPTLNVGYEVKSGLEKVTHPSRMLSLNKTKSVEALSAFAGDTPCLLSFKMDGLTVVLTYENGTLQRAVTRGNGEVGEDITHNAKVFKNLPLKIPFKGSLTLRGEAVISFKDFEMTNNNISEEEKYKNPRNLCSGTVRQLNSEICKKRNVCFIAFELVDAEDKEFQKKSEKLEYLDTLGFTTVKRMSVTGSTMEEAVNDFKGLIPENEFATDGLVLTIDDIAYSASLGATAKFPRDSIAFKWQDETAKTKLLSVEWNTSRTGLINPVAVFESVELEGTSVSRASLHNISICRALKLGIGDEITVYKANMIIPQVDENLTQSDTLEIPALCPVCGEETEIENITGSEVLKCVNPNCQAQRVKTLVHFVSRDCMNIEGLSEAGIEKFCQMGVIEYYPDIFLIKDHAEEITSLEGFGEKSFTKLCTSIEKSSHTYLHNFLYALGINNVGLATAKIICRHFDYDINAVKNASLEELTDIDGVGPIIAESVVKYFSHPHNTELLEKALYHLSFEAFTASESAITGKSFVITGDVHIFKNRKELKEKIESLGGKVTGSVSSKTDYLINNDLNSTSSKNKKAKELNIPIITEEEFTEKIQ